MSQDIRVEIYGQVYTLRTDLDPGYIQELARLVDARMRALAEQSDTVDTRRLAVLAAVTLGDELKQLQQKAEQAGGALPAELTSRIEACSRLLEAALVGSSRE